MRKTNLARMFARRVEGIFLSDFEQGEIGPDLFRHACLLGLEGLVSKHRDRPYRRWTLSALGEDEEPETPSHDAGAGCLPVRPYSQRKISG